MKKRFINQILLLLILTLGACNLNASSNEKNSNKSVKVENEKQRSIEIFEVADTLAFCEQIVPRKCLQVKREGKKKFTTLWDNIINFEFVSGYRYTLKVEVEKNPRPAKDTSGYKYYLKEIVKREKVENPDVNANLYLSKWFLISIDGQKVEKGKPFIVFDKNKGSFYGNSGCNSMGGQFELNEDKISFSSIRITKRACANSNEVESPFTSSLVKDVKFKVEIDRLYIYKNGKIFLEFKSNWH